ncbi:MAG TPA: DNA-formamidopyrimidine glycosylase family protein [bacterium]|nr:DNA-formamidopyrimidine glycosylase family protein [bacterium]
MPELPDVEVFRQYFDATSLHQRVTAVDTRDARVLEDITPETFREALTGREFAASSRHGKNFFAHLDAGNFLLLHFGMTGELKYFEHPDQEPDHTRVLFTFDNGWHLGYVNMRMLGKVNVISSIDEYVEKQSLGPDALQLSYDQFAGLLSSKRGMIKSAFMDQSLMAGLGNIYSDEVLYQSGIHPKRQMTGLGEDQYHTLYKKMCEVLNTAIDCQVDTTEFPENYLIKHRDQEDTCPRCGGDIRKIKVSSRSTYFCPDCQPE